ncbi:MAG: hypothetical protein ABJD53_01790 [Gammaproteobacteria bacterium]
MSSKPKIRRRTLVVGVALGTLAGLAWRESDPPAPEQNAHFEHPQETLLAFIATLFGHEITAPEREDLSDRLAPLLAAPEFGPNCRALAAHLEVLTQRIHGHEFQSCTRTQRESVVRQVMQIDYRSLLARLLDHLSPMQHTLHRIRWSAVEQLMWMYRNSSMPWRRRGYARWPGVAGDWREMLVPGRGYP